MKGKGDTFILLVSFSLVFSLLDQSEYVDSSCCLNDRRDMLHGWQELGYRSLPHGRSPFPGELRSGLLTPMATPRPPGPTSWEPKRSECSDKHGWLERSLHGRLGFTGGSSESKPTGGCTARRAEAIIGAFLGGFGALLSHPLLEMPMLEQKINLVRTTMK